MALIVQKFGGTSVGDLDRIEHVADTVAKAIKEKHQVVVVVSAMAGETDRLIQLAKKVSPALDGREYAALVTTGEQVTSALVAMALQKRGLPAQSFSGWQAGIQTDSAFKKARITDFDSAQLRKALEAGIIPVVAGFQGIDAESNLTTLGRGGSDTTAVAVAAALQATECQIFTDVDGVYTADPRMVPKARRLTQITFEEMVELAGQGAKVLQNRAVEFAGKYRVPLRVLSSFEEGPGTLINYEGARMEGPLVSGIAYNRNEAKITLHGLPDKIGMAFKVIGALGDAGIDVDMIIKNVGKNDLTDLTFTVHRDDYDKSMQLLKPLARELNVQKMTGDNGIGKLSIVGVGMRSHAGIAAKMFETLSKEGINVQLITTSEIKVSVVIDEKYLELGVRSLHEAFGLDKKSTEEFDPKSESHSETC